MNFSSFVLSLNINEALNILKLWSNDGKNHTYFTYLDYNYLITVMSFL